MSKFLRLRYKDGSWRVNPELRDRLMADAELEGSMTAVINRVLCDIYRVEYRPTGRGGEPEQGPDKINLTLQADLAQVLDVTRARRRLRSVQDLILADLALHYGLAPVSTAAA